MSCKSIECLTSVTHFADGFEAGFSSPFRFRCVLGRELYLRLITPTGAQTGWELLVRRAICVRLNVPIESISRAAKHHTADNFSLEFRWVSIQTDRYRAGSTHKFHLVGFAARYIIFTVDTSARAKMYKLTHRKAQACSTGTNRVPKHEDS